MIVQVHSAMETQNRGPDLAYNLEGVLHVNANFKNNEKILLESVKLKKKDR